VSFVIQLLKRAQNNAVILQMDNNGAGGGFEPTTSAPLGHTMLS
jgi:hypothetical protein